VFGRPENKLLFAEQVVVCQACRDSTCWKREIEGLLCVSVSASPYHTGILRARTGQIPPTFPYLAFLLNPVMVVVHSGRLHQ